MTVKIFKFKWLGWATVILALTGFVTFLFIYFLVTFKNIPINDKLFLIPFGGTFLMIALIVLWMIVLTEFNSLRISSDMIAFRNLFTRKTRAFTKADLKGYKAELTQGYLSIHLINSKNKTVKSIREMYYNDLPTIIKLLQLQPLN